MEEEIDLRLYFAAVIGGWYWILGAVIGTAVAAFIISSLLTPIYRTHALVAITEPSQLVQFEAGFESVEDIVPRPLLAYPELATSDEMLQGVLERIRPSLPEVMTLFQLQSSVAAVSGNDLSLIRLSVEHSEPRVAAAIANTWAAVFVEKTNQIYGQTEGPQLATFENQLADIADELETAELALVEFQSRNRIGIIDDELASLQNLRSTLLQDRAATMSLLRDLTSMRVHLSSQTADNITLADQIAALTIQLQVFSEGHEAQTNPISLQVDDSSLILTTESRLEQITMLESLENTLERRLEEELEAEIQELEPQILALQTERETFQAEQNRLERQRDTAQEAYLVLARRVEEERIAAQSALDSVRLASEAAAPAFPVSPRRSLNTLIGAFLGLVLSLFFILARSWYRSADKP